MGHIQNVFPQYIPRPWLNPAGANAGRGYYAVSARYSQATVAAASAVMSATS